MKSPRSPKEPTPTGGFGSTRESAAQKTDPTSSSQVRTSAHLVTATYVTNQQKEVNQLQNQVRFKHRKRTRKGRKEAIKEEVVSPEHAERAREEHQRALHEIKLINDSVAYTPFPVPKQPGSVKARGADEPSVMNSTAMLQSQAAAENEPEEVNAFNSSQKGLSTVPLVVQHQSSGPKVSQTREQSVQGTNGIELLHSNINRLEKLERRLMRGERHGNRKRS